MSSGRPTLNIGRLIFVVCSLYLSVDWVGRPTEGNCVSFCVFGRLAVDRSPNGSFASRSPVDRQSTGKPATEPTALSILGYSENLFSLFFLTEILGVVGILFQRFSAGKIRVLTFLSL